MKTRVFSFLVCLIFSVKPLLCQITLEQTYSSTGFFDLSTNATMYGNKLFYLVKLEVSGEKYVSVDLINQSVNFYNLNHSLFTTVSYSNVTLLNPPNMTTSAQKTQGQLLYFSEKLFDTDNQIEFMYCYYYVPQPPGAAYVITQIVNEDGTIMFSAPDEFPWVRPNYHNQYYPIYNTANGTKLILSKTDGNAKVYSLGGTWTGMKVNNNSPDSETLLSVYPNPSQSGGMITLVYDLPDGMNSADLKVYNSGGVEVKSYKIGRDMHQIRLEAGELPAGVYFYTVSSGSKIIGTKKSVVID